MDGVEKVGAFTALALVAVAVTVGLLLMFDRPAASPVAQKPKPAWYPVPGSTEVIEGEEFSLVCDQSVNREALADTARSVKLKVGDKVRTICVAVERGPGA